MRPQLYPWFMDMLLLNTRSAIEIWQRGLGAAALPWEAEGTVRCIYDGRRLSAYLPSLPSISRPIVIVAKGRDERSQSRNWESRVWSKELPPHSIYRLGNTGAFLCAPWFCYAQMAARLNLADAIRLGLELCGTHSTLPFTPGISTPFRVSEKDARNGFVSSSPITTAGRLRADLASSPVGPYTKAMSAARFLVDGSRSPGESRLFTLLCLPVKLGGYGLPFPLLNEGIELPMQLRRLAGANRFFCDFYYPERRLAIEYDGGYHGQEKQRMSDNLRQLVLESLDITFVRLDARQMANPMAMDMRAREISKRLGIRFREPSKRGMENRRKLRAQVLDYSRNVYA